MAGLTAGFDRMMTRGDATSSKFSACYFKAGRKLLNRGISPTPEQAADTAFDLGSLLI